MTVSDFKNGVHSRQKGISTAKGRDEVARAYTELIRFVMENIDRLGTDTAAVTSDTTQERTILLTTFLTVLERYERDFSVLLSVLGDCQQGIRQPEPIIECLVEQLQELLSFTRGLAKAPGEGPSGHAGVTGTPTCPANHPDVSAVALTTASADAGSTLATTTVQPPAWPWTLTTKD